MPRRQRIRNRQWMRPVSWYALNPWAGFPSKANLASNGKRSRAGGHGREGPCVPAGPQAERIGLPAYRWCQQPRGGLAGGTASPLVCSIRACRSHIRVHHRSHRHAYQGPPLRRNGLRVHQGEHHCLFTDRHSGRHCWPYSCCCFILTCIPISPPYSRAACFIMHCCSSWRAPCCICIITAGTGCREDLKSGCI